MIHSIQVSTEMNVYLIVEGNGEKKVYTHWVPLVNPKLSVVIIAWRKFNIIT